MGNQFLYVYKCLLCNAEYTTSYPIPVNELKCPFCGASTILIRTYLYIYDYEGTPIGIGQRALNKEGE